MSLRKCGASISRTSGSFVFHRALADRHCSDRTTVGAFAVWLNLGAGGAVPGSIVGRGTGAQLAAVVLPLGAAELAVTQLALGMAIYLGLMWRWDRRFFIERILVLVRLRRTRPVTHS